MQRRNPREDVIELSDDEDDTRASEEEEDDEDDGRPSSGHKRAGSGRAARSSDDDSEEGDEDDEERSADDDDEDDGDAQPNDATDDESPTASTSSARPPQSLADLPVLDAAALVDADADDAARIGADRTQEEADEEDVEEDEAERDAAMADDDDDEERHEAQLRREAAQQTLPDLHDPADIADAADSDSKDERPPPSLPAYHNPLFGRSPPSSSPPSSASPSSDGPSASFAVVDQRDDHPHPSPFTFVPAANARSEAADVLPHPSSSSSPPSSSSSVVPPASPPRAPAPISIPPPPRRRLPDEPPPAALLEELTLSLSSSPPTALIHRIASLTLSLEDERADRSWESQQFHLVIEQLRVDIDRQRVRGEQLERRWEAASAASATVSSLKKENARLLDLMQAGNVELDRLHGEKARAEKERRDSERQWKAKEAEWRHTADSRDSSEHRLGTLEAEKRLWDQQRQWLEAELSERSEETVQLRKAMAVERATLESQMAHLQTSVSLLESQLSSSASHATLSSSTLSSFHVQLNEAQQQHASAMMSLQQELATQTRLAELYSKGKEEEKRRAEDIRRRLTEVEARVAREVGSKEELRVMAEGTIATLQEQVRALRHDVEERQAEKERIVAQLHEEREKNAVQPAYPSPFARLSPADGSITVTQTTTSATLPSGQAELYSQVLSLRDELRAEREEGRRMELLLRQMSKEREDRQTEYEEHHNHFTRLVQSHDALTRQVEALRRAEDDWRRIEQRLTRELDTERNERSRLQQESDDLARQVRSLLQGKRRVRVEGGAEETEVRGVDQQAISSELVEYGDVDDLQRQNQRLLAMVRAFTAELDELKRRQADVDHRQAEDGAHTEQLQKAYALIDDLQKERGRMEKRIEQLAAGLKLRGRHSGGGRGSAGPHDLIVANGGAAVFDVRVGDGWLTQQQRQQDGEADVEQLTVALRTYEEKEKDWSADRGRWEKDKASMETQLSELTLSFTHYRQETAASLSSLQQSLANARASLSEKSNALALATGELKYLHERDAVLHKDEERRRVDDEKKDRKLSDLNDQVIRHQAALSELRADKAHLEEERRKEQKTSAFLTQENAILKEREERLREEERRRKDEMERQRAIIASFTALSASMEEKDRSDRQRLDEERSAMQRSVADLRAERDDERRKRAEEVAALSREKDDYRARAASLDASYQQLQQQHATASVALSGLRERLSAMEDSVAEKKKEVDLMREERERERAKLSGSALSWIHKEEEMQLRVQGLEAELKQKAAELSDVKKERDEAARMAREHEETLTLLTSNSAAYREEKEEEVRGLRDKNEALQRRIEELMDEVKRLTIERQAEEIAVEKERREMELRTRDLEREKAALRDEERTLRAAEAQGAEERRQLMERLRATQERYEREVTEHASSIADSAQSKQELSAAMDHLRATTDQLRSLQQTVDTQQAQGAVERAAWTRERDDLRAQLADKDKQLDLLYSQMEALALTLKRAQQEDVLAGLLSRRGDGTSDSGSSSASAGEDAQAKAIADLHEIVRYLRQEKETLETEGERRQQQLQRLTMELDDERRRRKDAEAREEKERKDRLAKEDAAQLQSSTSASSSSPAQLAGVENQLALLQDSNRLLREESRKKEERVRALEASLREVQSSVAPLRQELQVLRETVEARDDMLRVLREENARWQQRNQKLLDKYQQVDPEVHKQLSSELDDTKERLRRAEEALERERRERDAERLSLQQSAAQLTDTLSRQQHEGEEIGSRAEKLKAAAAFWRSKYTATQSELQQKQSEWNDRRRAEDDDATTAVAREKERAGEAERQLVRAMTLLRSTTQRMRQAQQEQAALQEQSAEKDRAWRAAEEAVLRELDTRQTLERRLEELKSTAAADRAALEAERQRLQRTLRDTQDALEARAAAAERDGAQARSLAPAAPPTSSAPASTSAISSMSPAPAKTAAPKAAAVKALSAATATPAAASPPVSLKRKAVASPSSGEAQQPTKRASAAVPETIAPSPASTSLMASAFAPSAFSFGSPSPTPPSAFPSFLNPTGPASGSAFGGFGGALSFPSTFSSPFGADSSPTSAFGSAAPASFAAASSAFGGFTSQSFATFSAPTTAVAAQSATEAEAETAEVAGEEGEVGDEDVTIEELPADEEAAATVDEPKPAEAESMAATHYDPSEPAEGESAEHDVHEDVADTHHDDAAPDEGDAGDVDDSAGSEVHAGEGVEDGATAADDVEGRGEEGDEEGNDAGEADETEQ